MEVYCFKNIEVRTDAGFKQQEVSLLTYVLLGKIKKHPNAAAAYLFSVSQIAR